MINLVVALPAEAKPIIQHFDLEKANNPEPFQIYQNGNFSLIISGVGKMAASFATAYLYVFLGKKPNQAWLNIGIAGHRRYSIGESFLAHQMIDRETSRTWNLPLVSQSLCPSETVCTVEQAEELYTESYLYDMEGSGFYATARRFSIAECIQCFKIVSDNPNFPCKKITASMVEKLIGSKLDTIEAITNELDELISHQSKVVLR